MIKMLIMCGTGIATSTIVSSKVKDWLDTKGYLDKVSIVQSKVSEEINHIDDYDIVVSTTVVPDEIKEKVISGLGVLTGIGMDEMFDQIEAKLKELL